MGEIEQFLKKRSDDGLLRRLRPIDFRKGGRIMSGGERYTDFSSNDYLALAEHPALLKAAGDALEKFGSSSCASRLLSGDLEIHHRLEEAIARFKGKESALVFNSGYQANAGIISAVCSKNDAVFSDKLNHASIVDGITLSGAAMFRFRHNDPEHLRSLLERERGKFNDAWIITETIFSMDGDRAPLKEFVGLKHEYGCSMMADEAHATGIYGPGGAGVVEEDGLSRDIDIIMGTFGKALGSFGAYAACSETMADYLVNTCRSFIYSTSLPPAVIACSLAALEIVREEPERRQALKELSCFLRGALLDRGLDTRGSSQIVPVILGDSARAQALADGLSRRGHWVMPIRPPTVPAKEARLRLSVTLHHDKNILEALADDIAELKTRIPG